MYISKFFASISLFIIIVLPMPINVITVNKDSNPIKNQLESTWLWDTEQIVQDSDKILNFFSTNNIKSLYL